MNTSRPFLAEIQLKPSAPVGSQDFPFNLPAVRALGRLALHPADTFLLGENGSGKSTLLEAVAVAMGYGAEEGGRNFHFATRESHSAPHAHLCLVRGIGRPRDGFFLRGNLS